MEDNQTESGLMVLSAGNLSTPLISGNDEHIFDDPRVRSFFIILYTTVFILCVFGNLAVLIVISFHARMCNVTKFFLGNLAFANLSVGIFCIYQSLTTYLYESWFYGDFMCRMHHFVQSLCHTASILIHVVIAVERYFVLLHPFPYRQKMTLGRLALVISLLWIMSAGIASPRLYYFGTITIRVARTKIEICIPRKTLYDSAMADTIYFVLLYVFPLTVISVLYAKIAKHLRTSSLLRASIRHTRNVTPNATPKPVVVYEAESTPSLPSDSLFQTDRTLSMKITMSDPTKVPRTDFATKITQSAYESGKGAPHVRENKHREGKLRKNMTGNHLRSSWPQIHKLCKTIRRSRSDSSLCSNFHKPNRLVFDSEKSSSIKSKSTKEIHSDRSKVPRRVDRSENPTGPTLAIRVQLKQRLHAVRILILIVLTFALLNLPYHIRKLCLNYLPSYDADSDTVHFLTPLTFLLMYSNCAVNPLLYGFFSRRFRQSFCDLLRCKRRRRFHHTVRREVM